MHTANTIWLWMAKLKTTSPRPSAARKETRIAGSRCFQSKCTRLARRREWTSTCDMATAIADLRLELRYRSTRNVRVVVLITRNLLMLVGGFSSSQLNVTSGKERHLRFDGDCRR